MGLPLDSYFLFFEKNKMKKVYLGIFAFVTVIAVIIAFENIMFPSMVLIFFTRIHSLFLGLSFMFLLGAIAGFFLGLAQGMKSENSGDAGSDFDL